MTHTLRGEDPDSKQNGISNFFLAFEILLKIKNSFFHLENNSLELVLSNLTSVLK